MTIGMLYPRDLIVRLMRGGRSFEKPSFYVEAAREAGENMFFFALEDIDWKRGTATGWNGVEPSWKRRPIPDVILNRTRTTSGYARRSIRRLLRLGKHVCNERNVVSKLAVHRMLAKDEALRPHLPETATVDRRKVKALLREHGTLYLKPKRASVGFGIIRVSRVDDDTFADINALGRTKRRKLGVRQIVKLVRGRRLGYLAQQGIALMQYRGSPVDFRVSVQRGEDGAWQCTGMVGKVARARSIVTNLHCGGKSIKVSRLFEEWGWDEDEMRSAIADLGVRIAAALERELPRIADLGLDIALDEHGHPWFIEANFRDLRITFRNAGERDVWRATFENPVRYAAALLRRTRGTAVPEAVVLASAVPNVIVHGSVFPELGAPEAEISVADDLRADDLGEDVPVEDVLEAEALESDVPEADDLEVDVLKAVILAADDPAADVPEAEILESAVLEAVAATAAAEG